MRHALGVLKVYYKADRRRDLMPTPPKTSTRKYSTQKEAIADPPIFS
jgi:hypothetical protein